MDYGEAGDNVGILLRGVGRNDVNRGMCLVKPGTLDVYRNFDAEVYILKEEEGGRKKPFYSGYTPQVLIDNLKCFIRTADVASEIFLPDDIKMALPGDNLNLKLKLKAPLPL